MRYTRPVPTLTLDIVERFAKQFVPRENGCWEWIRHTDTNGYGRFSIKGLAYPAHRVAYKIDLFPLTGWNEYGERDLLKAEKKCNVKFIQGDICERQDIPDNSVDLISCNAMIDLVPEEDRVLFYKEAYRMLKPGGQLSVCVVPLANGYGTDIFIERDRCTMPGWGVGFKLERNYPSGFIMEKPSLAT